MNARPPRHEPIPRPCCTGRNAMPAALAEAKPKLPTQPKEPS